MSFDPMTKDYQYGSFDGAIDVQILRYHDITAVSAAETHTLFKLLSDDRQIAVAFDLWQTALARRRGVELARKEALRIQSSLSSNSTRREQGKAELSA